MPTTFESAVVLLVLLAPGFIAVRVKNSVLPFRPPSAFQETVEAAILSALLLPVWLAFGSPILKARQHWALISTVPAQPDAWTLLPVAGVIALIYLVLAPTLGILYAFVHTRPPYGTKVARMLRSRLGVHAHPEVWDRAFNRDVQPWVRIVLRSGSSIQGIVRFAGLSPAGRQLLLAPLSGVPESLIRLDSDGQLLEDLTARAEGVWIEIGAEVLFVEIFG